MMTAVFFVMQMACAAHDVDHRGDTAMGFSHTATKHSFKLYEDGGAIEVRANDAADAKSVDAIRSHLKMIEKAFAAGDFTRPEAIHDKLPDGAAEMKELRSAIEYRYADLPNGGRVLITTSNARALEAVHRFLRFQIKEHQTGDSLEVGARE